MRRADKIIAASEMANLGYDDTGLRSYIIRVSTKEGGHTMPRIKLAKRASDMRNRATSILVDGDNSRVYANNDKSCAGNSVKLRAIEFARINTETLTTYWNGEDLLRADMERLLNSLKPV